MDRPGGRARSSSVGLSRLKGSADANAKRAPWPDCSVGPLGVPSQTCRMLVFGVERRKVEENRIAALALQRGLAYTDGDGKKVRAAVGGAVHETVWSTASRSDGSAQRGRSRSTTHGGNPKLGKTWSLRTLRTRNSFKMGNSRELGRHPKSHRHVREARGHSLACYSL